MLRLLNGVVITKSCAELVDRAFMAFPANFLAGDPEVSPPAAGDYRLVPALPRSALYAAVNSCVDCSDDREERETSKTVRRVFNDQRREQRQVQSDRRNRWQWIDGDSERPRKVRLHAP